MESPIEQGDLDFSSLELDPDDLYLPMGKGYRPTPEMEASLAELKQESARVCTPQYYVRYLPAGPSRGGMLQAGDTCFHAGGIIASALRPANRFRFRKTATESQGRHLPRLSPGCAGHGHCRGLRPRTLRPDRNTVAPRGIHQPSLQPGILRVEHFRTGKSLRPAASRPAGGPPERLLSDDSHQVRERYPRPGTRNPQTSLWMQNVRATRLLQKPRTIKTRQNTTR